MFRSSTSDTLPVGKFLAALRTSGIRMNDPRIHGTDNFHFCSNVFLNFFIFLSSITEMMENLRKVHRMSNYEGGSPETQNLNRETFKS